MRCGVLLATARRFQAHTVSLGVAFQVGAVGPAAYGTYRSDEGSGAAP